jgi:hypothetical protein
MIVIDTKNFEITHKLEHNFNSTLQDVHESGSLTLERYWSEIIINKSSGKVKAQKIFI